ncbi:hypothetical protein H0X32_00775 [Patescibacteria group bacterium]|nr:hypothetical protein [Patescibacteria group bacterium]
MSFFTHLIDLIFPPRASTVLVRSATFPLLSALLAPKIVMVENVSVVALLPYRTPLVQALIVAAKYENDRKAQELLGEVLATYIKERIKKWGSIVIVPLPLGKARRKARGYNQVEEIAKCTARHIGAGTKNLVQSDLLVRVHETVPQTSLGRMARKENMRHAFAVPARIGEKAHGSGSMDSSLTYLLLDDVLTTGATLAAAHAALLKAGAKHVIVLALAH